MPLLYYDNTRISTYRECNRKFYLRHIRDWTTDTTKIDLIFGLAWHEAMNVLWPAVHARKPDSWVLQEAAAAFVKCWVENDLIKPTAENYQVITDKWDKKNPWVAFAMLENYIKDRKSFIQACDTVEVERPFAVPLGMTVRVGDKDEEVYYIGRLDKVVRHRTEGRLVIEHKTTGWYAKEGGFRSDYLESFSPNSQVDGYLFAGNSLYQDGLKGLWVDAALTHKTVHDKFKFIPINRMFTMLDQWLAETKVWVNRIVGEMNDVETIPVEEGKAFANFPKNTGSCSNYSGCTYRDVCKYIPDPRRIDTPSGFKVEKWEPFDLLKIGEIMTKKGE